MKLEPCHVGGDLHKYENMTLEEVTMRGRHQNKLRKDIMVCQICGDTYDPWKDPRKHANV
jgi:hypothetical protein